jgi:NitT/TauT family transport system ATP-binding protein
VAVELRGVSVRFSHRAGIVTAVEDVSFRAAPGRFVSLIGPSGCGKSTLLKVILGVLPATAGEVWIDSQRVSGPQSHVGVVFQSPVLLAWRSVLDNVLLPIEIRGYPMAVYRERARRLLALVGLEGYERHWPRELSGGMQQRVAICRALVHDPPLVLFDEPFSAVDDLTRDQLNQEVLHIWEQTGKTVVLVTHNIGEAVYMSDEVIVLTARPARVATTVAIDLPRPRELEMRHTPAFVDYVRRLRAHLRL